jgi:hypothetical protein
VLRKSAKKHFIRSFCLDAERTKEIKASEKFAETCGGLELKV